MPTIYNKNTYATHFENSFCKTNNLYFFNRYKNESL
jgi:hypothetical protein